MDFDSLRQRKAGPLIAFLAVGVLVLSGCTQSGGSSQGGGSGIAYGASKSDYQAALADMDVVTLNMQSTAAKGAQTGRRFEEYAAAVTDWSGGKIKFNIAYANGIAPPAEVDDALKDGRLDVGSVITALEPSKFPVNNVAWDLTFIGRQTPVDGLLQWHGAMLQIASKTDAMYKEFENNGMKVLLPMFSSGSYFATCSQKRTDLAGLKGALTAIQSRVQSEQAKALGMSPVTINYAEMYESLQRKVVNCAMATLTVAQLGGFIRGAPYFSFDPNVGIASPGGSIAFGLDRWNALPRAAQQLLYDRLDVLLAANFDSTWNNVRDGLNSIKAANGEVAFLSEDARKALEASNQATLDKATSNTAVGDGAAFVRNVKEAEQSWATAVKELNITGVDVGYDGFLSWRESTKPDLKPYFDRLWKDVMASRRPA